MSLRIKLQILIAVLALVLVGTMIVLFVDDTRRSVGEEITASNRITQQMLGRLILVGSRNGIEEMAEYLRDLGRVRSNDITLYDASGGVLYRSPPPTYKAGREAPDWFARLVQPNPQTHGIDVGGGRLVITADASRAVLDGWDDMLHLLGVALSMFVLTNVVVYWIVGRAVSPFERILRSLSEMEAGAFHTRLPPLPGREAGAMGSAFNRMAGAVESNIEMRREATESAARLGMQRELTQSLHARIEDERHSLARELHDELGQQVTAIRSIALAIAQRAADDTGMRSAMQALTETSNQLYDNMHAMIPRLRPLALDTLGLGDAVADLVDDWRARATGIDFDLHIDHLPEEPGEAVRINAYRIVQEALSNAVRHASATRIAIRLGIKGDTLGLAVSDNGVGMPATTERSGRFGLIGMRERAEALGGSLRIGAMIGGGSEIDVHIPLHGQGRDP
jgi:two-component system sensor histidine kinase UhpB